MENKLILIKLIQNLKDKGFSHYTIEKEWWNNAENLNWAIDKKIYFPLIYSKEFAKFFWGTKEIDIFGGPSMEDWKFHLQQMVVSEDPLEYISKFL